MTTADTTPDPPNIVLNQRFNDMGALGEAIDWDLDFRQIEAGRLEASALMMAGQQCMTMRVRFNRKFHQRGCPPPGILTFGFPDRRSGNLRWNGTAASPGALLNFNDGRFEGVNPGNFRGYTLSFTEGLLQDVARTLGIDLDLEETLRSTGIWNPRGSEHDLLRRNLRLLEHTAVIGHQQGRLRLAEVFNFDLAASVIKILANGNAKANRETAPFRSAALKRALKLIDDPDQEFISVSDLCKKAGASWATLERGFAEEFGVTPKSYILSRRLTAIRNRLLKADPESVIADIANAWGFWHMGRFAAYYRKQFGELPSQTLSFNYRDS